MGPNPPPLFDSLPDFPLSSLMVPGKNGVAPQMCRIFLEIAEFSLFPEWNHQIGLWNFFTGPLDPFHPKASLTTENSPHEQRFFTDRSLFLVGGLFSSRFLAPYLYGSALHFLSLLYGRYKE